MHKASMYLYKYLCMYICMAQACTMMLIIQIVRAWRFALTNSWLLLHRKIAKLQVYQRQLIKLLCTLARYASLALLYRRSSVFKARWTCKHMYMYVCIYTGMHTYMCCNASSHVVAVSAQFIEFTQQSLPSAVRYCALRTQNQKCMNCHGCSPSLQQQ